MTSLSKDYRLSLYKELVELVKDKVYIVQYSLDDKLYIKKIIYPENYDIYLKLKELSSINLPIVYEILDFEDNIVVIEEYINGLTIDEIMAREKVLSEERVIEYTIDLCNILDILHNCNPPIIHRDIKPSNIIINNDNILKLVDFDVSRIYKDSSSTDTEILGTHGYAAPEQFGFRQSDARTDIYSLGVLMNVMLTGNFPTDNLYQGSLAPIISKCISLDPDKRYQTVKELKDALLKKEPEATKFNANKLDNFKLPGFRSGKLVFKIPALIWYSFLILTAIGLFTDNPTFKDRVADILVTTFFILATLLLGNYRNISNKLPIIRSDRHLIKFTGYALYLLLMLIIMASLLPA